jgi:hypothetical protein
MSNKIFQTILKRKIENFVSTFIEDSESIFFKGEKLIHPGEYGRYRENTLKELISIITNHKVSDGFIITPKNNVSTQIDVIVFKNDEAPLLENGNINFFTVESIIGIGEVKSTLNKTSFDSALVKLAKNKMLHKEKMGECIKQKYKGAEHDELVSFLVCKSTDFDLSKCNFNEIYTGIDKKYWHNFILVIEKGLVGYEFKFSELDAKDESIFVSNNGNINSTVWYEYPLYSFNGNFYPTKAVIHEDRSNFSHVQLFLTKLTRCLDYKNLYATEFLNYLDIPTAPVFIEV